MSDIITSAAFQEFIQKRCAEIITYSKPIRDINSLIIEAESKLKKTFSRSQLELFLQYEKLCSDSELLTEKTIYEECLIDGINVK